MESTILLLVPSLSTPFYFVSEQRLCGYNRQHNLHIVAILISWDSIFPRGQYPVEAVASRWLRGGFVPAENTAAQLFIRVLIVAV